ncbi:MAG: hypothetical protein QHH75_13840 [Bacillota bacterium]|jgi:hypothetical protein|nr:hypothetical protein [Bacillota bacterium]
MDERKMKCIVFLVIFMLTLLPGMQASACSPTWPWPGYPKQIDNSTQGYLYEVIPGVEFYSPIASLKFRQDIFDPDLELTRDLLDKAVIAEEVYKGPAEIEKVQDVFERLDKVMGKDTVQEFTKDVKIYILPDFSFANAKAENVGADAIDGYYFYEEREIWLKSGFSKNVLLHELGHCYDDYWKNKAGFYASDYLYFGVNYNPILNYFRVKSWLNNYTDWFAEAFVLRYGYPGSSGYPNLDKYERHREGVKAEILRGVEFISKHIVPDSNRGGTEEDPLFKFKIFKFKKWEV